MRVIVCGGRDFTDRQALYRALNLFHAEKGITLLIHGAARGADTLAHDWAMAVGINVLRVPAEWDRYGRRAGYLRNLAMADMEPDAVLAFPGGRGTEMMRQIARDRGIHVYNFVLRD